MRLLNAHTTEKDRLDYFFHPSTELWSLQCLILISFLSTHEIYSEPNPLDVTALCYGCNTWSEHKKETLRACFAIVSAQGLICQRQINNKCYRCKYKLSIRALIQSVKPYLVMHGTRLSFQVCKTAFLATSDLSIAFLKKPKFKKSPPIYPLCLDENHIKAAVLPGTVQNWPFGPVFYLLGVTRATKRSQMHDWDITPE